jgi:hypothetical protein
VYICRGSTHDDHDLEERPLAIRLNRERQKWSADFVDASQPFAVAHGWLSAV